MTDGWAYSFSDGKKIEREKTLILERCRWRDDDDDDGDDVTS